MYIKKFNELMEDTIIYKRYNGIADKIAKSAVAVFTEFENDEVTEISEELWMVRDIYIEDHNKEPQVLFVPKNKVNEFAEWATKGKTHLSLDQITINGWKIFVYPGSEYIFSK